MKIPCLLAGLCCVFTTGFAQNPAHELPFPRYHFLDFKKKESGLARVWLDSNRVGTWAPALVKSFIEIQITSEVANSTNLDFYQPTPTRWFDISGKLLGSGNHIKLNPFQFVANRDSSTKKRDPNDDISIKFYPYRQSNFRIDSLFMPSGRWLFFAGSNADGLDSIGQNHGLSKLLVGENAEMYSVMVHGYIFEIWNYSHFAGLPLPKSGKEEDTRTFQYAEFNKRLFQLPMNTEAK